MPLAWMQILRELFTNPTQKLAHNGPIKITMGQGQSRPGYANRSPSPTVANRTKYSVPADAQTSDPAFQVANYGGRAIHTQGGHVIFDGQTGIKGDDQHTVNIPSTFNEPVTCNQVVNFNDDVRHLGDLIDKYGKDSYSSVIRRIKLLSDMSGGVADAIGIDWQGNPVGIPFRVYDWFGLGSGPFSCAGKHSNGFCCYFSDGADPVTLLNKRMIPTTYTKSLADVAVRPNIGKWQLVSVNTLAADNPNCTSITVPSKLCCLNGQLVVCMRTIKFIACPLTIQQSALDCGSGSCP